MVGEPGPGRPDWPRIRPGSPAGPLLGQGAAHGASGSDRLRPDRACPRRLDHGLARGPSWPTSSTRSSRRPARSASSSRRRGARTSRTCSATPSIDAVVVASPTPTHVDLLTRAVRAGKAVLCEKPIDLDIARVDACRAEIGALADRVMLGFNRRFDPSFADIRARVSGGRDRHARAADDHQPGPGAAACGVRRHLRRAVPGHDDPRLRHGPLLPGRRRRGQRHRLEPGLARDRRGRRHRRRGGRAARRGRRAVLDHQLAPLRVRLRPAAGGVRRARHAQRGQPAARPASGSRAPTHTEVAPPYHNFFLDRYTPAYRAELDRFVTGVEQGGAFSPGFADGRAALVLADAANESLRTGAAVKVGALRGARTGRWWPSPRRRSRRCSAARRAPQAWRP